MKRTTIVLAFLAVVLVVTSSLGTAWGYFTTYAEAQGGYTIALGSKTEIHEGFSAWTKEVVVENKEGSQPVYVRAKAFSGSTYSLVYSDASGKWTPGKDGYYYYSDMVPGGASTEVLQVKIENVPENVVDGDSFNVVVIYESTPVLYDENGTPYADWDVKLDAGSSGGGQG